MRKSRIGEVTCYCNAYSFPHRFSGGNCTGKHLVIEYWDKVHGGGECRECLYLTDEDNYKYCQIVEGAECEIHCPIFQDYIRSNNIKLKD